MKHSDERLFSMAEVVSSHIPWVGMLLPDDVRFDNGPASLTIRANYSNLPMMVFHGSKDVVVPPRLGRQLCQDMFLFSPDLSGLVWQRFYEVPGYGHNDILLHEIPFLERVRHTLAVAKEFYRLRA
jgi:pimeloyl-ACP methyl ester carboxylesterase